MPHDFIACAVCTCEKSSLRFVKVACTLLIYSSLGPYSSSPRKSSLVLARISLSDRIPSSYFACFSSIIREFHSVSGSPFPSCTLLGPHTLSLVRQSDRSWSIESVRQLLPNKCEWGAASTSRGRFGLNFDDCQGRFDFFLFRYLILG